MKLYNLKHHLVVVVSLRRNVHKCLQLQETHTIPLRFHAEMHITCKNYITQTYKS